MRRHDELHLDRVEAACAALGGVQAIYDRLDAASDDEARTWLAERSAVEREAIATVVGLRMTAPDPNADLRALMALDERVIYARLKVATPEFRGRFAQYLQRRAELDTPEGLGRLLELIESFSAPGSV